MILAAGQSVLSRGLVSIRIGGDWFIDTWKHTKPPTLKALLHINSQLAN